MSGGSGDERKLVDVRGEYRYAARGGEPVEDARWQSCRVVVTTKRLVLGTDDGNRAVPLGDVSVLEADAVPGDAEPGGATPLGIGDAVLLVDAGDGTDLARACHRGIVEGRVVLTKHRAVVGGVVRDEAEWRKARLRLADDRVRLRFAEGSPAEFDVDAVGSVERSTETVAGQERTVVAVTFADEDDRSVETHLTGSEAVATALGALFEDVVSERRSDYELSETERQVLVALYSGVSPFEMAEFVGVDVDEVESIYQQLLEVGAVDEVRTRTEVTLNATGRNMASDAMSED